MLYQLSYIFTTTAYATVFYDSFSMKKVWFVLRQSRQITAETAYPLQRSLMGDHTDLSLWCRHANRFLSYW